MGELQAFLERMSALISERQNGRYFIVDPGDLIIRTLSRSQSLAQLQAGWLMLTQRLGAAQKFVNKYIVEYQDDEVPNSPRSTAPSLHQAIEAEPSLDNKLKLMFATVPRHSERLSSGDQLTLRKYGAWQDTKVVPRWLDSIPRDQTAEDRSRPSSPATDADRRSPSEQSKRSEGVEEVYSAGVKGKQRTVTWEVEGRPFDDSPLMGGGTPFKSSKKFFGQGNEALITPFPQKAPMNSAMSTGSTPNVLFGLGIPGSKTLDNWKGWGTSFRPPKEMKAIGNKHPPFQEGASGSRGGFETSGQTSTPLFPNSSYRNPNFTPAPIHPGVSASELEYIREHTFSAPEERAAEQEYTDREFVQRSGFPPPSEPSESGESDGSQPPPQQPPRGRRADNPNADRPPPQPPAPPPPPPPPAGPGGAGWPGVPPRRPWGNPPRGAPGGGTGGDPPDGPPGDLGGNPHQPQGNNQPQVPYAYGNFIPTIKAELKQEQLPSWDGNHDTAIEYFWRVQQLAALGGYIPQALGYWLWHNLKEGSTIQLWFAMLTPVQQEYMRSHYLNYLRGIKDGYLGRVWQMKMNKEYESQSFRQYGHENESPAKFVARWIMYTRMLVQSDNGGPLEVFLVMQRAPISWGPVINIDSINNTSELYAKVTEHERSLIYSSRMERSQLVTTDNLVYTMRKLGLMLTPAPSTPARRDPSSKTRPFRRANIGEAEPNDTEEPTEPAKNDKEVEDQDSLTMSESLNMEAMFKQAYEAVRGKPRPPPKNGYPFPKNDHVNTKMGKLPPSPCKVCGSAKHWDKECPDWNVYLEGRNRSANLVISSSEDDEMEHRYQYAYSVLLDSRISSDWSNRSELPQDFHKAAKELIAEIYYSGVEGRKSYSEKAEGEMRESEKRGSQTKDEQGQVTMIVEAKLAEVNDIQKTGEPPPTDL